ncbi:germ cell-less protein-like 1 [Caerostris extrusa]|uniref:Germ cell-less protein-like 1 n=1 Tax=Caerostris extrusa TaxID=172846 RepID=A0AAV4R3G9_CAEEX|nr:germ cell-less protein-like 1 [Caerostris extrusa]
MLRVDQGTDKGPKQVSEEDFNRDCVRCGRVLQTDSQHGWRWTGFNFGFDIVITYKSGCFKLQRYQINDSDTNLVFQNHMQIISLRSKKRHLMYRLGVYSLDKNGKTQMKGETGIETVTLKENEKITVLTFQEELQFPILLSANFLLATPVHSTDDIIPSGIRTSELYV